MLQFKEKTESYAISLNTDKISNIRMLNFNKFKENRKRTQ